MNHCDRSRQDFLVIQSCANTLAPSEIARDLNAHRRREGRPRSPPATNETLNLTNTSAVKYDQSYGAIPTRLTRSSELEPMKGISQLHCPTSNVLGWTTNLRPLSDIREITEPSLIDESARSHDVLMAALQSTNLMTCNGCQRQNSTASKKSHYHAGRSGHVIAEFEASTAAQAVEPDKQSEVSSAYSLSLENVPPRSSSKHRLEGREQSIPHLRLPDSRDTTSTAVQLSPRRDTGTDESRSAVPDAARSRRLYAKALANKPSLTQQPPFPKPPDIDILDFPIRKHSGFGMELQLVATEFVGGENIQGSLRVAISASERLKHSRMAIGRVSIDLIGSEETSGSRRSVFFNLTRELIDCKNPPPHGMVESIKQISATKSFWYLRPSVSSINFSLGLPRDVGPPPFSSKHAKIRYILAATVLLHDQGKEHLVRSSQELSILSIQKPENVLKPLPNALTACDEFIKEKEPLENIKLTAALRRQVWVSGTSVYVDVHIANNSKKPVKRLELQLERCVLYYKSTAIVAGRMIDQPQLFDNNERTTLAKRTIKASSSSDWIGVPPHSAEIRKVDLELPRGNATVKRGKFFEVRYLLSVSVGAMSKARLVTVQLPIVLIHMNSLDSSAAPSYHHNASTKRRSHPWRPSSRSPRKLRTDHATSVQSQAGKPSRNQSRARMVDIDMKPNIKLETLPTRNEPNGACHEDRMYRVVAPGKPDTTSSIIRKERLLREDDQETSKRMTTPFPAPWCPIAKQPDGLSGRQGQQLPLYRSSSPETRRSDAKQLYGLQGRLRTIRSADVMRNSYLEAQLHRPAQAEHDSDYSRAGRVQHYPILAPKDSFIQHTSGDTSGLRRRFRRMRSIERWKNSTGWFADRPTGKELSKVAQDRPAGNWI